MPLCTYWDRAGNEVRLETYPSSFLRWVPGEPLDDPYRTALERIEAALSIKARQLDVRGADISRSLVRPPRLPQGSRSSYPRHVRTVISISLGFGHRV